jgi:hypothetical protein
MVPICLQPHVISLLIKYRRRPHHHNQTTPAKPADPRGGREGYQSLLNTDMGLELDNLAR